MDIRSIFDFAKSVDGGELAEAWSQKFLKQAFNCVNSIKEMATLNNQLSADSYNKFKARKANLAAIAEVSGEARQFLDASSITDVKIVNAVNKLDSYTRKMIESTEYERAVKSLER